MREGKDRRVKRAARNQAPELLGEGPNNRIGSAEGIRFAFSKLPVPGLSQIVNVEPTNPAISDSTVTEPNESA